MEDTVGEVRTRPECPSTERPRHDATEEITAKESIRPTFDQSVWHYREQSVLIVATGVLLFWLASMFHYLLIALEESRRRETRELGLVSHPQHRPAGHTGVFAKDSYVAILKDGTRLAVSRSGYARLNALI